MRAEPVATAEPGTAWIPQAGSQVAFLTCPAFEVLYAGQRGNGKTDSLLMSFLKYVNRGFRSAWRGILFREEAVQLKDVIAKSQHWFPEIVPGAKWIAGGEDEWRFPDGERLLFRHAKRPADYRKQHGAAFPWIGFEELTNWPTGDLYALMKSLCRSSVPGIPRMVRATTNPWGPGHGWVKERFVDPAPFGTPIVDPVSGQVRVCINGRLDENRVLLAADPEYRQRIVEAANGDPLILKAWLEGSWDIVAGGIFAGRWDPAVHVLPPFRIPASWSVDRSFDWGSSKPYAVLYWAESDGTPAIMADGTQRTFPPGTVFLIAEIYGWNGKPNVGTGETVTQIARRVIDADASLPGTVLERSARVYAGPADSSIFDVRDGDSQAAEMARLGVQWTRANKGPGSRVQGWDRIGSMLLAAREQHMERPGLFVFSTCRNWLRTVPALARDAKNPDDVDTEQEDHAGDATRYRVLDEPATGVGVRRFKRVH